MHPLLQFLADALPRLDGRAADESETMIRREVARLEQCVPGETDAKGYPLGYFERTSGSFANEPFDLPEDPPPQKREAW